MVTVSDLSLLIGRLLPEPHAGLLSGILFGTKATIDRNLYDALVATGTLHIAALSGTNITILIRLAGVACLWLVGRRLASLLSIIFIIGFVWFVGPSPSVIRAAIMGSITLLGVFLGRQTLALWSWVAAVILMLLANPENIADVSFQLSAGAALGLILFGGDGKRGSTKPTVTEAADRIVKQKHLEGMDMPLSQYPRALAISSFGIVSSLLYQDLRTTLAAQVFTLPIMFFTFRQISFISPLANLAVGWTIPVVTIGGFIAVIFSFMFFPLGQLTAFGVWVFLEYMRLCLLWLGSLPYAAISF